MPHVESQRLKIAYPTLREGNRKMKSSFWAEGHRLFLALSIAIIVITFAVTIVWIKHQQVQAGYDISQLHRQRNQLMDLNRNLNVELANLTSLDRLERLAKQELGLVTPRPDQVQVVE